VSSSRPPNYNSAVLRSSVRADQSVGLSRLARLWLEAWNGQAPHEVGAWRPGAARRARPVSHISSASLRGRAHAAV